ncbi:tyrosine-type recombinase/integrase [Streptomyces sp. AA4]|uniref:tyrosine-type recombinase/integrase n=1 Tax=Actinomycetes TaxID=1760 RepID=UPI00336A0A5E
MPRAHLASQDEAKARLGSDWVESDLLFTCPDGSPLHPADVADEFARLIREAGLPPITSCGLRHGAATLALGAGVDMKVIQHMLRHSSIKVTMDLCPTSPGKPPPTPPANSPELSPQDASAPRARSRASLGRAGDHDGQSATGRSASR